MKNMLSEAFIEERFYRMALSISLQEKSDKMSEAENVDYSLQMAHFH